MRQVLGWLTHKDNREAAVTLLTLVTALLGGGWFLYDRFLAPSDPGPAPVAQSAEIRGSAGNVQQVAKGAVAVIAGDGATVTIGLTLEQYEAGLVRREEEIRVELEGAHADEKDALIAQLDELHRRTADVETSFAVRKAELARVITRLDEVASGLPQARLEAARRALAEGDTGAADALFAEVEALETEAIGRAATAAFERGMLAEADIRWTDAAGHYATAARLVPSFEHLRKAGEYAWRTGDYAAALRLREDLVGIAVAEHGAGSAEHAAALNGLALTLRTTGRRAEAEPLYREALAIRETTLGKAHPDYAQSLNNLAALLHGARRHAEAEPLYREALALRETVLGKAHPDYAGSLNNLALLLRDTDRLTEAEPLLREALATGEAALGKAHPAYATSLSNLATVFWATDRYEEAEPLYREALAIRETALGKAHPAYAASLNNLALLLRDTGRDTEAASLLREALVILTRSLGADHPTTRTVAENLAAWEEAQGRGDGVE